MSGSAGIRGYYYQVLTGLLDSVEDDLWESIRIEPSTKDDKVDIEWVYNDSFRTVQVKSSINNFERGKVINWVYSLVKDSQTTYEMFNLPIKYELFLIGTVDRNTDKWISDLRGGRLEIKEGNKLKEIESELPNVEVTKQNFDFESLQALSYVRMQEYLSRNGKEAKIEDIKTLCNVIVNELFTFSLLGRPMPKILFTKLIDKHINSSEYGITHITNHTPKLSLAFYEKNKVTESDQMIGIHLQNTPLLNKHRIDALKSLKKAKGIKLPPVEPNTIDSEKPKSPVDFMKNIDTQINLKALLNSNNSIGEFASFKRIPSINSYFKVQWSEEDILELKELSKNILDIELDDDVFYFGGLEKRVIDTTLMIEPRGTEDEKEKYFAIEDAHVDLVSYQFLNEYTNYLNTCYPLPIILKNTGAIADEEIHVTLKFPNTALVVTPEKMKAPYEIFIEKFINDNSVFNNLLIPARDHKVIEYEGTSFKMPVLKQFLQNYNYTPADFNCHLNSLFNYEHFLEGDQDIVQYEFKSLNPSQKVAFPTFLLVQTDLDMNIEYTITSKHLSRPIEGTLNWFHPENIKS